MYISNLVEKRNRSGLVLFIALLVLTTVFFVQKSFSAGRIVTETIASEALRDNKLGDTNVRNMTIYLPPSYDSSNMSYSVIYLLHGFGGDERSLVDEVGEDFAAALIDELIRTEVIKEVIIIMPDGSNKYGGSYYLNSELIGNYEDYTAVEIVNHIDDKYRTLRDWNGRAIGGASMGGYGSMVLAMKHSETFCAVASLSPPLGFDPIAAAMIPEIIKENPNGMKGPGAGQYTNYFYALSAALSPNLDNPPFFVDLPFEYPSGKIIEAVSNLWQKDNPIVLLADHAESMMKMKGIYIDVGDHDLPGFLAAADVFHEKLLDMGIEHKYNVYAGDHDDNGVERALDSLQFLSELLLDPTAHSSVDSRGKLLSLWSAIKSLP